LFKIEILRVFYDLGNDCFTRCLDKTHIPKSHPLQRNINHEEIDENRTEPINQIPSVSERTYKLMAKIETRNRRQTTDEHSVRENANRIG
jgi:hypothetical protein